jgi:hypothetical protein
MKSGKVNIKKLPDEGKVIVTRRSVWEMLVSITNVEIAGGKFGKNILGRITAARFDNRQVRKDVEELQDTIKKEYGHSIHKNPDHFSEDDNMGFRKYMHKHEKYNKFLDQEIEMDVLQKIKLSELEDSEYPVSLIDSLYDILIVKDESHKE